MRAISRFRAPTQKCSQQKPGGQDDDILLYFDRSALTNKQNECQGDGASSDYEEAIESIRYLDFKKREDLVGDATTPAFASASYSEDGVTGNLGQLPIAITDCSVSRTFVPIFGDHGCLSGKRQIGNFSYLYKRWNYYTRFKAVVPGDTFSTPRDGNSDLFRLDRYKTWYDCSELGILEGKRVSFAE